MNRIVFAMTVAAVMTGVLTLVSFSMADVTVVCGKESASASSVHGLSASPVSRSLALLALAC